MEENILPNFESYVVEEEEGSGIKVLKMYWIFHQNFTNPFIIVDLFKNPNMQVVMALCTGQGGRKMELLLPSSVSETKSVMLFLAFNKLYSFYCHLQNYQILTGLRLSEIFSLDNTII